MNITNIISKLPRKGTQDTAHSIGSVTKIIVHHDAEWRSDNYDSVKRYIAQANYHINSKGDDGLQYHYKIDNVGEVFQCRTLTDTLWHCSNYPVNRASIAICIDGDFTKQKPTREQYKSLKELLVWLCTQHPEFPADGNDVFGHSEVALAGYGTACPGGILTFVKGFRSNINIAVPSVPFNDGSMGPVPIAIPQTQNPPITPPPVVVQTPFKGDETTTPEPIVEPTVPVVEEVTVEEVKTPTTSPETATAENIVKLAWGLIQKLVSWLVGVLKIKRR